MLRDPSKCLPTQITSTVMSNIILERNSSGNNSSVQFSTESGIIPPGCASVTTTSPTASVAGIIRCP